MSLRVPPIMGSVCGFLGNAILTGMILLLVFAVFATAGPQPCPSDPSLPPATCNGDINGDQALTLADPIHLLEYLFQGGPAPAAIAQTSEGTFVHVTLSQDQENVATGQQVLIQFDEEQIDTLDEFDPIGHSFTASQAGTYLVVLHISWVDLAATGPASTYDAGVLVNGLTIARDFEQDFSFDVLTCSLSKFINLSVGDTITATVRHFAGVTIYDISGDESQTFLQIVRR